MVKPGVANGRRLLLITWLFVALAAFVFVELRSAGRELQKRRDLVLQTDKKGFTQKGMTVTASKISIVDDKLVDAIGDALPMPKKTTVLKIELLIKYNNIESSTSNTCSVFVLTEDGKRWRAGDLVPAAKNLKSGSATDCSPAYGTTYERGQTLRDIEYFVLPKTSVEKVESVEISIPRRGKFSGNLLRRIPISGFEVSS